MSEYDVPIPLPVKYDIDYDDVLGIDCDQSAADVATFIIPFKCRVFEAGVVCTEVCAGSSSTPVVDFDKRPTAGSDTGRGAADIAHLVMGALAAGQAMYDLAGQGVVLDPGDEVVVQLTTPAVGTPTGHFKPYLLVQFEPELRSNLANQNLTA